MALSLKWNFGLSSCDGRCSDIVNYSSSHQTTSEGDDARVFYTSGHTGVIYDSHLKRQVFLKGHVNQLSAVGITKDSNRFLITADQGPDKSVLIVWNTLSLGKTTKGTDGSANHVLDSPVPIKTIFDIHGGRGVLCLDISGDSRYLATLGADSPQSICIWEWAQLTGSMLKQQFVIQKDLALKTIKFHPEDPSLLIGNNRKSVMFFQWDSKQFRMLPPIVNNKDLLHEMPEYTVSSFLPLLTGEDEKAAAEYVGTGSSVSLIKAKTDILAPQALSATTTGHVVVWSDRSLDNLMVQLSPKGQMAAIKYARLHTGAINDMRIRENKYIVTAGADGFIRVHDFQFKMIAWFDKIKCGPIASFSFRPTSKPDINSLNGCCIKSTDGKIYKLSDKSDAKMIVQSMGVHTTCAAVSPKVSEFVLGARDGRLQMWNYETKQLLAQRTFEHPLSCLAFTNDGRFLAVGFENGRISFITADHQMTDIPRPSTTKMSAQAPVNRYCNFDISSHPITLITCSENSVYMACADPSGKVSVFSYTPYKPDLDPEWQWLGNCRSHTGPISGLQFGLTVDSNKITLISVGQDRHMIEYDLEKTSIVEGIQLRKRSQVEQYSVPTAISAAPQIDAVARFIYMADSEMKIKTVNASSQMIRQTTAAPEYGSLIQRMQILPSEFGTDAFLVYNTADKLLGMSKLPLDGNPARSMAVIAHPGRILAVSCSALGKYVLTLGDRDGAINMWETDTNVLEGQFQTAPANPFAQMLPGGENGEFYKDMQDLFYYAQLKNQGEDTMEKRNYEKEVDIERVPEMMQAVGFYPSEQEIECMINEIKYQNVIETGLPKTKISFEEWVKLYVNYRPCEALTVEDIVDALKDLNTIDNDNQVSMDKLTTALGEFGEVFPPQEFKEILRNLTENHPKLRQEIGEQVPLEDFLTGVLGFLPISTGTAETA